MGWGFWEQKRNYQTFMMQFLGTHGPTDFLFTFLFPLT
jgi:hypothetical protein